MYMCVSFIHIEHVRNITLPKRFVCVVLVHLYRMLCVFTCVVDTTQNLSFTIIYM